MVRDQKRRLDRWYRITDGAEAGEVPPTLIEALEDDLNTPRALAVLEDLATPEGAVELKAGAQFLGLLQSNADDWFRGDTGEDALSEDEIAKRLAEREAARAAKDFVKADQIRKELEAAGIALEDGPEGTIWRHLD